MQEIVGQGIIISGRMMADHMPDYLLSVLQSMAASAAVDRQTTTVGDRAGEDVLEDIHLHMDGTRDG